MHSDGYICQRRYQVVSVGADIAFDADPKFFACLVRFESFFFSSRRRHTRCICDWSSVVFSSDLHTRQASLNQDSSFSSSIAAKTAFRQMRCVPCGSAVGDQDDRIARLAVASRAAGDGLQGRQGGVDGGEVVQPRGGEELAMTDDRSEERRVGKECRSRWSPYH